MGALSVEHDNKRQNKYTVVTRKYQRNVIDNASLVVSSVTIDDNYLFNQHS
jgi:hypothetical protein